MQVEEMWGNPVELLEPALGEAPEALDPIDVARATGELILVVLDPVVLGVADIHESVVADVGVGVQRARQLDTSLDDVLQGLTPHVRHHLRIDLAVPLQQAEDDDLLAGTPAMSAWNAPRTEVALIELDLAGKRGLCLAGLGEPDADPTVESVRGIAMHARQLGCLRGREIQGEAAQEIPKTGLANSRA